MNAFSLPSIFFGIYLIIPFLLGCFLLFGVNIKTEDKTKAQRLAGVLFIIDALYLAVRTYMLTIDGLDHHIFRHCFFVFDSSVITLFALIPYTVIAERYPKWWMYLIALLPLVTLPLVWQPQLVNWTAWSHLLPLLVATVELSISARLIRKRDRNLEHQYANPEHRRKSWLIYITIGFILVTLASLLRYLIHGIVWYNILVSMAWSGLMVVIYIILVRQLPIAETPQPASATAATISNSLKITAKTERTMLDEVEKQLQEQCINQHLYLKGDLTLDSLARLCGTNRTYLYYYLREKKHVSFYEYINSLRLTEADKLLKDTSLSQEMIALQCGFNSARTMRSAYRKIRGKMLQR